MRGSAELDELDLLLVAALQHAPRADWPEIGRALEVSASTAARRWERLTGAGLAWLSCHPLRLPGAAPFAAIIEVDCAPAQVHAVATHIAADPHVFTVDHLTGARDLMVIAAFVDHGSLARYVGARLNALDGVVATRTQIATAIHLEASSWRLDRAGRRRPITTRRAAAPAVRAAPDAVDMALMGALGEDCRLPAAELARRTGVSATTVRRRLRQLETNHFIAYRCEIARSMSGWPVALHLWGQLRPDHLTHVTAQLIGMRETRLCASLTGPHTLFTTVWLRSMREIHAFETRLSTKIPELTVADRAISLWPVKLGAQLLDPAGRRIRSIPVAPWTDNEAAGREEAVRYPGGPA